uniref:Uncharacterized protein n=1 Tax=Lotus japonicus TaxID=34305 RepID=I3SKF7_LOTJA|nr:unknown [Lotus japonicus]
MPIGRTTCYFECFLCLIFYAQQVCEGQL